MSAHSDSTEALGTGETSRTVPLGAFGRDARALVAKGKIAIPVRQDKQPAVTAYLSIGRPYARTLASDPRFAGCALGIRTGRENNLFVADIDTTDRAVERAAARIFGEPTVIVATASDKRHFYYAYTDEPRIVRPFKDPSFPVDLIGAKGFAVAPSSEFATGTYRFLKGSYEDLDRLAPAKPSWRDALPGESQKATRPDKAKASPVSIDGMRNNALFDYLRSLAPTCSSLAELLEIGRRLNSEFADPLPDAEVVRTVESVWSYKERNRLITPNNPAVMLRLSDLEEFVASASEPNTPDALLLYLHLQRMHSNRDTFAVSPKAMARARTIGRWSPARLIKARDRLLDLQRLEVAEEGSAKPGDAYQYRLRTGETSRTNVTYTSLPSPPPSVIGERKKGDPTLTLQSATAASRAAGRLKSKRGPA